MGQAMYRLSITHLAVEIIGIVISDGVRWALVKMNICKLLTHWVGSPLCVHMFNISA